MYYSTEKKNNMFNTSRSSCRLHQSAGGTSSIGNISLLVAQCTIMYILFTTFVELSIVEFSLFLFCKIIFKEATDKVENCRPVKILTSLSKILEKIITKCWSKFHLDQQILTPERFGSRKELSTWDAILIFF